MYSAVYKCVCKHHSETLHTDLLTLVEGIVKNWSNSLEVHVVSNQRQGNKQSKLTDIIYRRGGNHRQQLSIAGFISEFNSIMNQYFGALGSIVPIFTYLVITLFPLKKEKECNIFLINDRFIIAEPFLHWKSLKYRFEYRASSTLHNAYIWSIH